MTRVALLVTGKAEYAALHTSLARSFPTLTFVQHASPPGSPMNSFTSNRLRDDAPLTHPGRDGNELLTPLAKLVDQLILGVHPGRNGVAYDYAILVDDLELENLDQPGRVVALVRSAVAARLDAQWPSEASRSRAREAVRTRCSFHLLCPMLESYFYCEQAALDRAGRVTGRPSVVDPSDADVERFSAPDADYLAVAPPEDASKQRAKGDWRRAPEARARHPKKYLQYLCDPLLDGATNYHEATTGARALATLDWRAVIAGRGTTRFARSLLADLARIAPPAPPLRAPPDDACAPETAAFGDRARVLRNL